MSVQKPCEQWSVTRKIISSSTPVVKCEYLGSHRGYALEVLKGFGIAAERVEFVGYRLRHSYLDLFQRIDIFSSWRVAPDDLPVRRISFGSTAPLLSIACGAAALVLLLLNRIRSATCSRDGKPAR